MPKLQTLEVNVKGMDCADCAQHVRRAIEGVPGVQSARVYLSSEKAIIQHATTEDIRAQIDKAVGAAGYALVAAEPEMQAAAPLSDLNRRLLIFFGLVFVVVLLVVVLGEWLGLFEAITARLPWPLSLAAILLLGWPIFRNVLRAALQRRVIAHSLMTVGLIAAILVGEWATAAIVVIFMRIGDYVERFTTERSRGALKDLTAMAPRRARVKRDGREVEVPLAEVQDGEVVIVRPGEQLPVDGQVVAGQATIDQAVITGESMPLEAGPGAKLFAASLVSLGSLRVRTTAVGPDSTFGSVIKLVEEAERQRANVQRIADKFSAYYLPVVATVAALTFLISGNTLATVAVLVVACSCSFALATPIAMLASIGASARRGLLVKGGRVLEQLAAADVLLLDKTGTLTLGRPQITDVVSLNGLPEAQILSLAASAERYSEHPFAEAVREAARTQNLLLFEPQQFEALPGKGVRAEVGGALVEVGRQAWSAQTYSSTLVQELIAQGKTLIHVSCEGELLGLLAASDTLRPEVPAALEELRSLGMQRLELLTGDNERTAAALAEELGIPFRAALLPEDKIAIVKEYQERGHSVVMIGDGVNDAPALAQADVGIAMGAAGTDLAMEAAHITLMREDWSLIPQVLGIARRTLRVVRWNIGFTALYNFLGLTLASLGFLPPVLAAAAQSLPDLGILANSSRLLRQK